MIVLCAVIVRMEQNAMVLQKFCVSPPMILLKPFKRTSSSLLSRIGNPCRENLKQYIEADVLGALIVEVHNALLPVCAIRVSDLHSKCVKVLCKDSLYSYIIHIPNNYERH